MRKFHRKPVEVTAWHFDGTPESVKGMEEGTGTFLPGEMGREARFYIPGIAFAYPGDVIIKEGYELQVMSEARFNDTHTAVVDGPAEIKQEAPKAEPAPSRLTLPSLSRKRK